VSASLKLLQNSKLQFLQISTSGMVVVETSLTYHSSINASVSGSSRRLLCSVLSTIRF